MTRDELKNLLTMAANLAKSQEEYDLVKKFCQNENIDIDKLKHSSPFGNRKHVSDALLLLLVCGVIGIALTAIYFKVVFFIGG